MMAFDRKNWLDRECEYPNRRLLYPTDGGASRSYTVERDEGLVYEDGDRFDAATMNDLELRVEAGLAEAGAGLAAHAANTSNPHAVSKGQVGLGNVDNAQQATKAEFNTHTGSRANPHEVSKSQVGLGNVDNVQQASKTEFNTHVNSTANPHRVTAGQTGAVATTGGRMTGLLRVEENGIEFITGANTMHAFMGHGAFGDAQFDFRQSGFGYLFRDLQGNFLPVYGSNTSPPSAAVYKRDIVPMELDEAAKLLEVPVYAYRYRPDSGFDDGQVHYGVLAEELAGISETYVYRALGEVEGACYPSLVPALLRLVQAQEARLCALEARVEGGGGNGL